MRNPEITFDEMVFTTMINGAGFEYVNYSFGADADWHRLHFEKDGRKVSITAKGREIRKQKTEEAMISLVKAKCKHAWNINV